MKKLARRIAVVIGAVAVSAGLVGATTVPAQAADRGTTTSVVNRFSDSSWPW